MTTLYTCWTAIALGVTVFAAAAEQPAQGARYRARIDESASVTSSNSVHPLARAEFDRGDVAPATRMERMMLLLKPTPAREEALNALLEAQQDPQSALYHQWLTPAEYGARFGASAGDVARAAAWLRAHGFSIDDIPAGQRLIVFSGNAGMVADGFHTELHRFQIAGVEHVANVQDPEIPRALSTAVSGIVSLHNFRRRTAMVPRRAVKSRAEWNLSGEHYLFPADFAAIYDLNPLYATGGQGGGTAIAIVGRSNINLSDVATFRQMVGMGANDPTVVTDGADPGLVEGDQDEATLDVEWAGAVAPAAQVKLVAAASTTLTDGVDLSAEYIVNHATAPVMSVSYASCEEEMTSGELAFYNSLWQQAAAEGITVLVASGDAGAAGCNQGSDARGTRAAVNGLCTSAYATCVGGTELQEGARPEQYWGLANTASEGSALGYIPEEAWNESGASGGSGLWSTGGGVSAVYPEPAWQVGVSGMGAANGMRAVPDVSLTAAGHDGYVIVENGTEWIVSGTSAAAPSLSGVMALVIQKLGNKAQGNANPMFYELAAEADAPFHRTPAGTNTVPGVAGFTANDATYNAATGLGSVDATLLVSAWFRSSAPVRMHMHKGKIPAPRGH